tara:strand:- start:632 stop:1162 length:531 start_codon:yes stop_codon:yes gene_type:complete
MAIKRSLTSMQKRFAQLLVYGDPETGKALSKSEAAKIAGYSSNRNNRSGYELTNPRIHPSVVKYIEHLEEEMLEKHKVTKLNHLAQLDRIKELAIKKGNMSAAHNAEKSRGQVEGLYINRSLIKTGKLEDMTKEELDREIKQTEEDWALIAAPDKTKTSESSSPADEESSSDSSSS